MARVTRSARSLVDGLRQLAGSSQQVQISNALKPYAPQEGWHELNTPNEPAMLNGWVHFKDYFSADDDYNRVAFFRDPAGFVHLRGTIFMPQTSGLPRSFMFILPLGYRPSGRTAIVSSVTDFSSIGSRACNVSVMPHTVVGTQQPPGAVGLSDINDTDQPLLQNQARVSLDNVIFPADLSVQIG